MTYETFSYFWLSDGSSKILSLLENPHLRAMIENLVNTRKPDLAMASAMREPIFTELADACLSIVDRENPNLEPEAVSLTGEFNFEVWCKPLDSNYY